MATTTVNEIKFFSLSHTHTFRHIFTLPGFATSSPELDTCPEGKGWKCNDNDTLGRQDVGKIFLAMASEKLRSRRFLRKASHGELLTFIVDVVIIIIRFSNDARYFINPNMSDLLSPLNA